MFMQLQIHQGAPAEQVQLLVLAATEQLCLSGSSFCALLKGASVVVVAVVVEERGLTHSFYPVWLHHLKKI